MDTASGHHHSHQGPMDAVLDARQQPRGCHLMAQVVAGVGSQAEIAIHQGHKGQGFSPGTEAQQLWASGTWSGSLAGQAKPPPPACCPGAPPSTCCPEGGCARDSPSAPRGRCPGSHRSRSRMAPQDSLPAAPQPQGPWLSSQIGCLGDSLCCYLSQIPKNHAREPGVEVG